LIDEGRRHRRRYLEDGGNEPIDAEELVRTPETAEDEALVADDPTEGASET
jgi:hypothetical protein